MKLLFGSLIIILGSQLSVHAQDTLNLSQVESNLKKHVLFLADDRLEGRRAGTRGEEKAMLYIAARFKENGVSPGGINGYFQSFDIRDGREMKPESFLSINGQQLRRDTDFFFLPFSGNQTMKGSFSVAADSVSSIQIRDIGRILATDRDNPHFDLKATLYGLAVEVEKNGARGLIIYNSAPGAEGLHFDRRDRSRALSIPVIYLGRDLAEEFLRAPGKKAEIKLCSSIAEVVRTGHNVIGYLDNQAEKTVVLGAHFDHLGYGEDGNSMLRSGGRQIHNGADDNASGTAALIELGRLLKKDPASRSSNYLFIAFSGEELGLFGSKYFSENPTIDLGTVNYMINMDMVGRLNDSTHALTIGGFGTSPTWVDVVKEGNSGDFNIKIDSSGAGPSDHTSFYRKNIPVLFYFTGLHSDYHKPSDDANKINYRGASLIVRHILNLIDKLDQRPRLVFLKTRELQVSTTAFKVTLGVMPDYTYSGEGMRIDGVSDGRPAQRAGLVGGDIILALGEHQVTNMETYMKALNQFKKGDKTRVRFKRGSEIIERDLEF